MTTVLVPRLAIDGGAPVRTTLLPYGRQSVDASDIAAVSGMLTEALLTTGPHVAALEASLASVCGAPAAAVNNGTSALQAAYHALGLGEGDEIVVPPLTFAATAVSALWLGARPVFADIDPATLTLSTEAAARACTDRTRFVVPVDFAGLPADYDALRAATGRPLCADAAHSLGAVYRGAPAQAAVDAATLSFHPVKHITTGEGGAVVSRDPEVVARVKRLRHHNLLPDPDTGAWAYTLEAPGLNLRLPDINAALGVSQLRRLPAFLERRRALARRYTALLGTGPIAESLELPPGGDESAWHLYVLRVRGAFAGRRRWVFDALRAEGIGVQVHYAPLHLHPLFRRTGGYAPGDCPVAEDYGARCFSIPLFPDMTDADQDDVLSALHKVLQGKNAP